MTQKKKTIITGDDQHGTLVRTRQESGGRLKARFDHGIQVWIPSDRVDLQPDGTYRVPLALDQLERVATRKSPGESSTIPIIEETLHIEKRQMITGKTRIRKKVTRREQVVDETGYEEDVQIERVPINRVLKKPVNVRHENGTTIIPIMEEVLVVEKRLILKEELRITKRRKETHHPQRVTLAREEPEIEHIDLKPERPRAKNKT